MFLGSYLIFIYLGTMKLWGRQAMGGIRSKDQKKKKDCSFLLWLSLFGEGSHGDKDSSSEDQRHWEH